MITLTTRAADQVRVSIESTDAEGLALRVAVKRGADGKFDYAMGFDLPDNNDNVSKSEGVDIVVAPTSSELLHGASIDFVELEPDRFQFIFLNPNDPDFVPPVESP